MIGKGSNKGVICTWIPPLKYNDIGTDDLPLGFQLKFSPGTNDDTGTLISANLPLISTAIISPSSEECLCFFSCDDAGTKCKQYISPMNCMYALWTQWHAVTSWKLSLQSFCVDSSYEIFCSLQQRSTEIQLALVVLRTLHGIHTLIRCWLIIYYG